MSTQQAVTPDAKAAPLLERVALACWFWLAAAAGLAVWACVVGAEQRAVAAAASLALAPALAGFILLPSLRRKWGEAGLIGAWLLAATGLAAGSGGAHSPLIAALMIGPSLALALGGRWLREASVAALAGFAIAAALGGVAEPLPLGAYPAAMSAAALALSFAFMAIPAPRAAPAGERLMGERIAEVSHELRTPLTHILGFSEMIERRIFGDLGERYVEYAGLIRKSGNHLLALVNDLLDLSKIEAGRYDLDRESFDARDLVEEVVRMSADAAQKKTIALGLVTPEAPLMADADPRAVRRMLLNTVSNAIKFTPEGGKVMVCASGRDGVLTLETSDSGPGIPEAERERLGRAFERGAGARRIEGAGLGLSLVRALAELHGGALSFDDAPEGGALVRVTLPVLKS